MYVVTGEVPKRAPTDVATASTQKALVLPSKSPVTGSSIFEYGAMANSSPYHLGEESGGQGHCCWEQQEVHAHVAHSRLDGLSDAKREVTRFGDRER